MKVRLSDLRRWIREEVERNMLRSAGLVGGGGNIAASDGINAGIPGLGPEEENEKDDKEYGKEQKKSSLAARVLDRYPGKG